MAKTPRPFLSLQARKILVDTALLAQHEWRLKDRPTQNALLMRELYKTAKMNPATVKVLLTYCRGYITKATLLVREQRLQPQQNRSTDPSVIASDLSHPLNPCSPENIATCLALNASLNPLFQQFLAQLATNEETTEEETAENEQHDNKSE